MTSSLTALKLTASLALAACIALPASQTFAQEAAVSAPTLPAIGLQKIDTKIGNGREAIAGSTVVVHYTGWLFNANTADQHGKKFDSSVGRGPFSFPLGAGRVIKGWDQGVAGMKIGGKRTLIIPAELGYGERGAGGVIPPNASLIFDVELLDIR